MNIDTTLKISQTTFYVVAIVLTMLTYLNARKGLLNTVNTEYHKHAIERLKELSTELLSEFDEFSENYWARNKSLDEALQHIRDDFSENRDHIKKPDDFMGIPVPNDYRKISNWANKVRSDPFIPRKLREHIYDLLNSRADVMISACHVCFERYQRALLDGKAGKDAERDNAAVSNRIVDELNKRGCGISKIEEEVHAIRIEIQQYFEKHSPNTMA